MWSSSLLTLGSSSGDRAARLSTFLSILRLREREFRLLRARSMESQKTEGKDTSHALRLVGSKPFFSDREDPSPHKEGRICGLRDFRLYLRKYSD